MSLFLITLIALIAAIILLYNRLVRSRNRVDTAWSDIEVQLQRRHDLIPNLVSAVDQYAGYERATLKAVAALRTEAARVTDVDARGKVEEDLGSGMHRLIALAENYPDLKANENFLNLQTELAEIEDSLQFARRYYNGSVRDFNTMTETVPSNFITHVFGFGTRVFFQKSSDDVADVPSVRLRSSE